MIGVEVIASGSSGNCYRLKSGCSSLLLEAGIPIAKIKEAINYELSRLDGCLITHEHKDHSKAVAQLIAAGVDVYASEGTRNVLVSPLIRPLSPSKCMRIGRWLVLPFKAFHDASEPLGYVISDGEDTLLFATDTYWIHERFKGLTLIMLEVNYIEKQLQASLEAGIMNAARAARVTNSHFSLEHAVLYLSSLDLSRVRQIWTIHGSKDNSIPSVVKDTLERATGKPVAVF